ncbi:MAG TPA: ribonuclease P protein component 4 [Thermoplasmata archaeon]|nr:ribonuclease P protein component 4 [Thermoplasmata archaeon]
MIRLAQERISDLFALAEAESRRGEGLTLSTRYVTLARRIGMRYNVRLLPEFRELYCRGCSSYWVEGETVRTRLRSGRRVRTCLKCGRVRRVVLRPDRPPGPSADLAMRRAAPTEEAVLVDLDAADEESGPDEGEDG